MSFARRGFRFFLAALLLFSQQQAGLHLLGHGLALLSTPALGHASAPRTGPDSNDPQEPLCAKCLALAHLEHAVGVAVPAFAPIVSSYEPVEAPTALRLDLAFVTAYRSRAPPVLA